jgi:RNA polymerase I-specific transcription initiation factor RRN6
MAEPSLSDQSYGHFGQPVYDVHTKRWIFGRSSVDSWHYLPLGVITRTVAATKNFQDEETSTLRREVERQDKRYDRALNTEIRRIVQGNPEIQAAEDILNPLIRGSEAVIAALAQYDPAAGDILAFGTAAVSDGQNRHNKTRLLAIPGGEGGEMLRLVRLETEEYGWHGHEARLLVPSPSQEMGWWVGKGAPIQQISTPEILAHEDQGSFVAARLPGTTLLFRPRYRITHVPPAGVHFGCIISPSRVDVNLLLEIKPRDWQGQQHADVSFNPWNQHRLAIVDQAGNWAVFKLEREYKGSEVFIIKLAHRGSLEGFKEESQVWDQTSKAQQDGWARILWVADKNTLLVCTRRQLQLFSLSLKTTLLFSSFLPNNQWILDARRCPAAPTWVFILTSTQVLWLEILPESDRGVDLEAKAGRILLSAHHFRDSSDISLQMHVENDLDGMTYLSTMIGKIETDFE